MKKLISMLLCLAMLALPVLSNAEGVIGGSDGPTVIFTSEEPRDLNKQALDAGRRVTSTYTISDFTMTGTEEDAEMATIITSLMQSIGITVGQQGEETDFVLTIDGNDVLTLGWVLNGDDAYIRSNLIGGTVVIGGSEVEGLVTRLIDMLAQIGALTAEDAENAKAELPEVIDSYTAEIEGALSSPLSYDAMAAWDYSALTDAILPILEKVQTVEEVVVPRMCDPAVSGLSLSVSNEDLLNLLTGAVQFIKDNPDLMAYLSDSLGYYTEEDIDEMWEMYKGFNWYTEEEFRAIWPTMEGTLNNALESLAAKPVLFFEDVQILIYLDADNAPVYITAYLPIDLVDDSTVVGAETVTDIIAETEEAAEEVPAEENVIETPAEETIADATETDVVEEEPTQLVLELVYTRQTVAEGVSHTCTLSGEGDTISVTALEQGDTLHAELAIVETIDEVPTTDMTGVLDMTYIDTDTAYKIDLKASLTDEEKTMTLEVVSDYTINGVDFSGTDYIAFSFDGLSIAVSGTSQTTDPVPSIMTGDVARPAELDDAAFANWFVGAYSSIQSWLTTLLSSLPEDVLYYFLMNAY